MLLHALGVMRRIELLLAQHRVPQGRTVVVASLHAALLLLKEVGSVNARGYLELTREGLIVAMSLDLDASSLSVIGIDFGGYLCDFVVRYKNIGTRQITQGVHGACGPRVYSRFLHHRIPPGLLG